MTDVVLAETWLNRFIERARPVYAAAGFPIPDNTRARIGFPSTGMRSNRIGECWSSVASADNHFEIYVSPKVVEGEARLADILSHELCHAAAAMDHGPVFGKLARAIGLEGKLTCTTAGADWFKWAAPILAELGPMDFGALNATASPRKKKATFLRKVECPDCGWLARVTKSHILPFTHLVCPVPECGGVLECDL